MKLFRKYFKTKLIVSVLFVVTLIGCSDEASKDSDSETEGEIRIAYSVQADTLDPHLASANATKDPARHIYETLVALNSDFEVAPLLAESFEESEDGKIVTFYLREGVKFHNGKEMKAEDVVASLERWKETPFIKDKLGDSTVTAEDDYTVVFNIENPTSVTMFTFAEPSRFGAIMPKEVIEEADAAGVKEHIGTGPFKFVEWAQDQYIHLTKFEEYQPLSTPSDGLTGKKEALVKDIYFEIVPDESTRLAGVQTGEYDFAHNISYDNYDQLVATDGVVANVFTFGNETMIFNKKEGIFSDVKARQAVNAALDFEGILMGAFANEDFFTLDNGFMFPEQTNWYTDAGSEYYNQNDPDKAKELLEEIGYAGEEITLLASRDVSHHYNASVITQEQLKEVGLNVKLDVYDWATLLERLNDPSTYDMFYTAFPIQIIPHQFAYLNPEYTGWTDSAKISKLLEEIANEPDEEKAKEKFAELQLVMWEELPVINLGKVSSIAGVRESVDGYFDFIGPIFWNTSNVK